MSQIKYYLGEHPFPGQYGSIYVIYNTIQYNARYVFKYTINICTDYNMIEMIIQEN